MRTKRLLLFHPPAEANRNIFLFDHGENARKCLDWLEHVTRLAPESGERIESQRFVLTVEVDTSGGTFLCRAVYIFNDTNVKWLTFNYEFFPANSDPMHFNPLT